MFDDDRSAGLEVPEADGPIQAPRADLAAVGPESDRLDEVGVPMKRRQTPAGRNLPEPDAPVLARRGEVATVGAEGEVQDVTFVREDRQRLHARCRVPELDGPIPRACGQPFPVGAVGRAVDPFLVTFEIVMFAAGFEIPHLDDFQARDGEPFPVRMERDLVHTAAGTSERLDLLSRCHVPNLDAPDLVHRCRPRTPRRATGRRG